MNLLNRNNKSHKKDEIAELKSQIEALKSKLDGTSINETIKPELLLSWTVPQRNMKNVEKSWFKIVTLGGVVGMIVLVIIGEFVGLITLTALLFMIFVLAITPSDSHEISVYTNGIDIERLYEWDEFEEYWFSTDNSQIILNINTKNKIPGRLIILLPRENINFKRGVVEIFDKFIHRKKLNYHSNIITQTWYDKIINGRIVEFDD